MGIGNPIPKIGRTINNFGNMETFSYIGIQFLRAVWGIGMTVGIVLGLLRIGIWMSERHKDGTHKNEK